MKDKLSAHQETISILSQQKEAQIKLYKTREDKELDEVIALENKVKVLDNIVYKIGCYNDNLALMLAPESDEVIRLEKQSRSKLNRSRLRHTFVNNGSSNESFNKQTTVLEKRMDESIPCLNDEMVANLRYFNSLELEVDSLRSQLETQKTQILNEIDRLSREYYYADHMNAILGVYIEIDEVTNLQCDYLELLEKYEGLEIELSKSKIMSKSFEALQKHAINLEIDLQQCQENIKNDKSFTENLSKEFRKEREQYFEMQDLKAQLQDKGIVIRVIPTTSVSRPLPKSNPMGDSIMHNNSQGKKQKVEDQRRNVKFSKNKTSVTACNDSLNAKTLNVNSREFSIPRTPQQNGIAERKNITLIKAARTMLADLLLSIPFWAEAVNTAFYVQNRLLVTKPHNKTPYELLHGRLPSIGFMRPFGCPVTILNTLDPLGKFQAKVDEESRVHNSTDPAPTCQKKASVHNSSDPALTRQVMASVHNSTDPAPTCQKKASVHNSSDPALTRQ
nr:ribonuclease H-like domain-containing protein [Tanacetum cinerariifolium]